MPARIRHPLRARSTVAPASIAALIMLALQCVVPVSLAHAADSWSRLGLGYGDMRSLAIDATTPTTLYTGMFPDGVFKSTDGGVRWRASKSGLPDGFVINALAIDRSMPTTLYAGTNGRGAFKSSDGGASWGAINDSLPGGTFVVNDLAIDPGASKTLYLGALQGCLDCTGGVFKSTDGGGSWSSTGLAAVDVVALAIDPLASSRLYAGGGRMYKSTDGGTSWNEKDDGLTGFIFALKVDPQTPRILYAGTEGGGAFRTTDGGDTWAAINDGLVGPVGALAIDPLAPNTVYAGTGGILGFEGGGLFKSTDGGAEWTAVNAGLPAKPTVTVLAIDPLMPDTVYAAAATGSFPALRGVSKTVNGGRTWKTASGGLPGHPVVGALAVDPQTSNTLYVGTTTGNASTGLFKSIDRGTEWNMLSPNLVDASGATVGVDALLVDPLAPETLYVGSGVGVAKSTDRGATWSPSNTGLTDPSGHVQPVFGLIVDHHKTLRLFALTPHGPFRTLDGALSWNPSNAGLVGMVTTLAIDPLTPATVYAGTECADCAAGVFQSMNGGMTWSATGLSSAGVVALVIDPLAPSTLYAATHSAVLKSTDAGVSWMQMNSGLPNADLTALAIEESGTRALYAGTDAGVFVSRNGAANWTIFNGPLPGNASVTALALDPQAPGVLYAGTDDGVFAPPSAAFTVFRTNDADDANPGDGVCATIVGECTLRAAIQEANALPGDDRIAVFAGTYVLSGGPLTITDDLTIVGGGTDTTVIDGNGQDIVLNIAAHAGISGLTIQNGHGRGNGGGIVNGGNATLSNVTISGNTTESGESSPAYGGGVLNYGTLTLTDVTISGNTAGPGIGPPAYGGGLYNAGSATLTNVTISDNTAHTREGSATWGGGIYNSGMLTATNCTISDNRAVEDMQLDGRGGGMYNAGSALLVNVTVSANTASATTDAGGDLFNGSGVLTLKNAIVADAATCGNCSGTVVSLGYNLSSDASCGFTAAGDRNSIDPKLGPLQDNGGATFTQALLRGSPAIDGGSPDCPPPATDQRGAKRTPPCDIGAYELTPINCVGDCDSSGSVNVDEIITLVNIVLGTPQAAACAPGIPSGADVDIALILQAVNHALSGCS